MPTARLMLGLRSCELDDRQFVKYLPFRKLQPPKKMEGLHILFHSSLYCAAEPVPSDRENTPITYWARYYLPLQPQEQDGIVVHGYERGKKTVSSAVPSPRGVVANSFPTAGSTRRRS